MVRAWPAPFGIDFAILKTGDQGPEFSVAKPRRSCRPSSAIPSGHIYPVIGEYPSRRQPRPAPDAPDRAVAA